MEREILTEVARQAEELEQGEQTPHVRQQAWNLVNWMARRVWSMDLKNRAGRIRARLKAVTETAGEQTFAR